MHRDLPAIDTAPPDLAGIQKVALLILALSREQAETLLQLFQPDEIEALKAATKDLPSIDAEFMLSVIDEFEDELLNGVNFPAAGEETDALFQVNSGNSEDSDIIETTVFDVWQELPKQEDEFLLDFLSSEAPVTIAYIFSNTDAALAARLLPLLEQAKRSAIVRCMMHQSEISEIAAQAVEQTLSDLLQQAGQGDLVIENRKRTANVINRIDDDVREELLSQLLQSDPEDARELQRLLFSFEDVAKLDAAGRGMLFDNVSAESVIAALIGTADTLRELVLSALSARARRMVEAELNSDPNLSEAEIKKARQEISEEALRLIQEGAVQLSDAEG